MLNDGGKVTANMSVYIHVIIPTYIVHVIDIQDTHSRVKNSCHIRIRVEQYLFVVSFKSLNVQSAAPLPCLGRWYSPLVASCCFWCTRC